ncbi:phycocyanin [Myxosarcina sp. GI1]|uniref:phycocyanin n=1 Tax=Myxosarcina sp. GI1 TaxID=1541065 RepID=UPI00055D9FBA|nr:phycocyanin [Myxosarcina sp. GI1]
MFSGIVGRNQNNSENKFVTKNELEASYRNAREANASLQAAQSLTNNFDLLVKEAANVVYAKYPHTTQRPEPQYASTPVGKAKCERDIGYYLRMVTYSLIAGSTRPMDEFFLQGLNEMNRALELSSSWYIEALKYIKENHGLTNLAAQKTNEYIDYIISALS